MCSVSLYSSISQDERLETNSSFSFRHDGSDDSSSKDLSRGFRYKLVKGVSVVSSKDVSQVSPKSRPKIQTNKSSPKLVRRNGISSREVKGAIVEQHKVKDGAGQVLTHGDPKMHGKEMLNNDSCRYVCEPLGDTENVTTEGKLLNMNVKSDHTIAKIRGQSSVKSTSGSVNSMALRPPSAAPCALGVVPGSSIPKPTAAVKGTSKPAKEDRNQVVSPLKQPIVHRDGLPRQKQMGNRDSEIGGSISVALVSPMPSENSSSMSESTYSTSTGQSNSNSSDSSVIYKPSSESGSEMGKPVCKKIETTFDNLDKVIYSLMSVSLETSSHCGDNCNKL